MNSNGRVPVFTDFRNLWTKRNRTYIVNLSNSEQKTGLIFYLRLFSIRCIIQNETVNLICKGQRCYYVNQKP